MSTYINRKYQGCPWSNWAWSKFTAAAVKRTCSCHRIDPETGNDLGVIKGMAHNVPAGSNGAVLAKQMMLAMTAEARRNFLSMLSVSVVPSANLELIELFDSPEDNIYIDTASESEEQKETVQTNYDQVQSPEDFQLESTE